MKTRIIAAAVLLPLLLLVLFVLPKIFLTVLVGVMAAIGAYELTAGTGLVKHIRLSVYSMLAAFWVCLWCGLGISNAWLLLGVLLFWSALFAETMLCDMKISFDKIAICSVAGVLLPLLFGSLIRIHSGEYGRYLICVPFILAFMSDTGAYFVGCKFGKHKLAPTISPKKSKEGVLGGVAGGFVSMLIFCLVLQLVFDFTPNYIFATIYGLVGSLVAVFGDLCFSVIKRQTGIKDYGNLIPGHGGMLDRFDSMMLVGPLAEILLILLPLVV